MKLTVHANIAVVTLYGFYMHLALATVIAAVYIYDKPVYRATLQLWNGISFMSVSLEIKSVALFQRHFLLHLQRLPVSMLAFPVRNTLDTVLLYSYFKILHIQEVTVLHKYTIEYVAMLFHECQ